MKYKFCASAIAVILMAGAHVGAASAQDVRTYDYSGFYVGVHAGQAFGDTDVSSAITGEQRSCVIICFGPWTAYSVPDPAATASSDVKGMIGGVAVGYNYQWNGFVFGAEADINASEVNSSPAALFSAFGGNLQIGSFSTELDWYGTARARLGYDLSGGLLVYGTGGLAYGRVTNSIGYRLGTFAESFSSSEMRTGWTAGAGMEMPLFKSNRLRLKTEYLYTDLGGGEFFNQALPDAYLLLVDTRNNQAAASADLKFHTVRVGVNFAF